MVLFRHYQFLLLMVFKVVSNVKEQDHSQTDLHWYWDLEIWSTQLTHTWCYSIYHPRQGIIDIEFTDLHWYCDQLSSHIQDVFQYLILTREILILNLTLSISISLNAILSDIPCQKTNKWRSKNKKILIFLPSMR